jgi:hypothetical protein
MFAFMGITAIYGLLRPQYLRMSLIILVTFNACVVAALVALPARQST